MFASGYLFVSSIVCRFASSKVILKCLNMSVLPSSLGTSSESAKAMLALIVVSPILIFTLWMYAGIMTLPIPIIGL